MTIMLRLRGLGAERALLRWCEDALHADGWQALRLSARISATGYLGLRMRHSEIIMLGWYLVVTAMYMGLLSPQRPHRDS
jgi:hypothetical protein